MMKTLTLLLLVLSLPLIVSCNQEMKAKDETPIIGNRNGDFQGCVSAEGIDVDKVRVLFSQPSDSTEFYVYRNGSLVFTTTQRSDTFFIDQNLSEGQTYTYTCKALIGKTVLDGTERVEGTTLVVNDPIFGGIVSAEELSLASDTAKRVKVTWHPQTGGAIANNYKIFATPGTTIDFSKPPKSIVSAGTFSVTLTNIGEDVPYTFAVRACTKESELLPEKCDTNTVTRYLRVTDKGKPAVYSTVSTQLSLAKDNGRVKLTIPWLDTQGGVFKRQIFRKQLTGCASSCTVDKGVYLSGNGAYVPDPKPIMEYFDTTVASNIDYEYWVVDTEPTANLTVESNHAVISTGDLRPPTFLGLDSLAYKAGQEDKTLVLNFKSLPYEGYDNTHPDSAMSYLIYKLELTDPLAIPANPCTSLNSVVTEIPLTSVHAANLPGETPVSYELTGLQPRKHIAICLKAKDLAGNISTNINFNNDSVAGHHRVMKDITPPVFYGVNSVVMQGSNMVLGWNLANPGGADSAVNMKQYKLKFLKGISEGIALDADAQEWRTTTIPALDSNKLGVTLSKTMNCLISGGGTAPCYGDGESIGIVVDVCDDANTNGIFDYSISGADNCTNINDASLATRYSFQSPVNWIAIRDITPPANFPGLLSAAIPGGSQSQSALTWSEPLFSNWTDYYGFRVYHVKSDGDSSDESRLEFVGDIPCNIANNSVSSQDCPQHLTSWTLSSLNANRTYKFYMRAYDGENPPNETAVNITDGNTQTVKTGDTEAPKWTGGQSNLESEIDSNLGTGNYRIKFYPPTDNQYALEPGSKVFYSVFYRRDPKATSISFDRAAFKSSIIDPVSDDMQPPAGWYGLKNFSINTNMSPTGNADYSIDAGGKFGVLFTPGLLDENKKVTFIVCARDSMKNLECASDFTSIEIDDTTPPVIDSIAATMNRSTVVAAGSISKKWTIDVSVLDTSTVTVKIYRKFTNTSDFPTSMTTTDSCVTNTVHCLVDTISNIMDSSVRSSVLETSDGNYVYAHYLLDAVDLGSGTHTTKTFTFLAHYPIQIVSQSSGNGHCALFSSGKVQCWGSQNHGYPHVSGSLAMNHSYGFVQLGTEKVVKLSAGTSHTCALYQNKKMRCWGDGAGGQLGHGRFGTGFAIGKNEFPNTYPTIDVLKVPEDDGFDIHDISAIHNRTCVVLKNSSNQYRYKCWGENNTSSANDSNYMLGMGTSLGSIESRPQNMLSRVLADPTNEITLLGGNNVHSCYFNKSSNKLFCSGSFAYGSMPVSNNTCWYYYSINSCMYANTPGEITGVVDLQDLVYGDYHTCSLSTSGVINCWGINSHGQLGKVITRRASIANSYYRTISSANHRPSSYITGFSSFPNFKFDPTNSDPVKKIVAAGNSNCALSTAGYVKCWGGLTAEIGMGADASFLDGDAESPGSDLMTYNTALVSASNQKSIEDVTTVVQLGVHASERAVDISAGPSQRCAILNHGDVQCWGSAANNTVTNPLALSLNHEPVFTDSSSIGTVADPVPYDIDRWVVINLVTANDPDYGSNVRYLIKNLDQLNLGVLECTNASGAFVPATVGIEVFPPYQCRYKNAFGSQAEFSYSATDGVASVDKNVYVGPRLGTPLAFYPKQIVAGAGHTCSLMEDASTQKNEIRCWGKNDLGQLGYGHSVNVGNLVDVHTNVSYKSGEFGNVPVWNTASPVTSNIVKIVAGLNHTCAMLENADSSREVKCWGSNLNGRLFVPYDANNYNIGDNEVVYNMPSAQTGVKDVFAGYNATCVLKTNGNLLCKGVLGTNTAIDFTETSIANIKKVTVGYEHICLLTDSGSATSIRCRGLNSYGQLATGSLTTLNTFGSAIAMPGLKSLDVVAGQYHTCVLNENTSTQKRSISCWGHGNGIGGSSNGTAHFGGNVGDQVYDTKRAFDLGQYSILSFASANDNKTCAHISGGAVKCWGSNANYSMPMPASFITTGVHVFVDYYPVTKIGSIPTAGVNSMGLGTTHGCSSNTNNEIYCWGYDNLGQTGQNLTVSTPTYTSPVVVKSTLYDSRLNHKPYFLSTEKDNFEIVAIQNVLKEVLLVKAYDYDWDDVLTYSTTNLTPNIGSFTKCLDRASSSSNNDVTCEYLFSDPLGSDDTSFTYRATDMSGAFETKQVKIVLKTIEPDSMDAIIAGASHTCAIFKNDKGVMCWGDNRYGQLGQGNTVSSGIPADVRPGSFGMSKILAPAEISAGKKIKQLALGLNHTCALIENASQFGQVKCWGKNDLSQLGVSHVLTIGDNEFPYENDYIAFGLSDDVEKISAGSDYTCALIKDTGTMSRSVKCWGEGTYRVPSSLNVVYEQNGDASYPVDFEVSFRGSSPGGHGCALFSNKKVACWGHYASTSNNYGQIGRDTTTLYPYLRTGADAGLGSVGYVLSASAEISDVAVTTSASCALISNDLNDPTIGGKVFCWGQSSRLGTGASQNVGDAAIRAVGSSYDAGSFVQLSEPATKLSAAGWGTFCAILKSGNAQCWGDTSNFQGGVTSSFSGLPFAKFGSGKLGVNIIGVSNGQNHSCLILDNFNSICWGKNSDTDTGFCMTGGSACSGSNSYANAVSGSSYVYPPTAVNHAPQFRLASETIYLPAGETGFAIEKATDQDNDTLSYSDNHADITCNSTTLACTVAGSTSPLSVTITVSDGKGGSAIKDVTIYRNAPEVAQVVFGIGHTCTLLKYVDLKKNKMKCWGLNSKGQLGLGDTTLRSVPSLVPVLTSAESTAGKYIHQIAASGNRSCALIHDINDPDYSGLRCWGEGFEKASNRFISSSQYSTGSFPNYIYRASPEILTVLNIASFTDAFSVSALTGTDSMFSNGYGNFVNLGDGAGTVPSSLGDMSVLTAGELSADRKIDQIAMGPYHTCVVHKNAAESESAVRCWGAAHGGRLGRGSPVSSVGASGAGDATLRASASTISFSTGVCEMRVSTLGEKSQGAFVENSTARPFIRYTDNTDNNYFFKCINGGNDSDLGPLPSTTLSTTGSSIRRCQYSSPTTCTTFAGFPNINSSLSAPATPITAPVPLLPSAQADTILDNAGVMSQLRVGSDHVCVKASNDIDNYCWGTLDQAGGTVWTPTVNFVNGEKTALGYRSSCVVSASGTLNCYGVRSSSVDTSSARQTDISESTSACVLIGNYGQETSYVKCFGKQQSWTYNPAAPWCSVTYTPNNLGIAEVSDPRNNPSYSPANCDPYLPISRSPKIVGISEQILSSESLSVDLKMPGEKITYLNSSQDGTISCAVLNKTRMRCWGRNTNGELGYGGTNTIIYSQAALTPRQRGDVAIILSTDSNDI